MPTKLVRVRDLPETPGRGVQLYCWRCDGEFSACRGDYFMAHPDTVLRCGCTRGRPALRLVRKMIERIPLRGASALEAR